MLLQTNGRYTSSPLLLIILWIVVPISDELFDFSKILIGMEDSRYSTKASLNVVNTNYAPVSNAIIMV